MPELALEDIKQSKINMSRMMVEIMRRILALEERGDEVLQIMSTEDEWNALRSKALRSAGWK